MYLMVKLGSFLMDLYGVPRIGDVNGVELGFQTSGVRCLQLWILGFWKIGSWI